MHSGAIRDSVVPSISSSTISSVDNALLSSFSSMHMSMETKVNLNNCLVIVVSNTSSMRP